uniref:Cytochrome b561 domain-containing protein n=1 Tax=Glossina austeni TaxID=7395 RepID=A0A1A9V7A1_GLOAU
MVTSGGLLAVAGTAKVFFNVEIHYTSFHGKIGIASLIMLLLNIVSGACYIASAVILDDLRLFHNFLGISSFALGMYSQLTGYNSGFFRRNFVRVRLYKILTFAVLIVGAFHPFDALLDAIETSLQFN